MFNNKFLLFTISLLIVWFILLVKNVDIPICFDKDSQFVGWQRLLTYGNCVALASFVMIVIAILGINRLKHRLCGSPGSLSIKIEIVSERNNLYIENLTTIFTVVGSALYSVDSLRDFIVLCAILVVVAVCFLKTNLYFCNPVMSALGYQIFVVKSDCDDIPDNSVAIFNGRLSDKEDYDYYHIADNVFYLKKV